MGIYLLSSFRTLLLKIAAAKIAKWLQEAVSQIEENVIKIELW